MKFAACATILAFIVTERTVLGFSPRLTIQKCFLSAKIRTILCATPSIEPSAVVDDEDEDFAAMQLEIAQMISSSTDISNNMPTAVPSTADDSVKYNKYIAVASAVLGSFLFAFQHSQPVSGVALMHAMERDSVDLQVAVCNGKPTIIDFYADWCESCKVMAPSMRYVETQYKDKINFISIDGSNSKNADMVKRFRVDGIPHLAFIGSNQEVKTALVGSIPKPILKDQILALLQGKPLPYEGYDAFEEESHFPLSDISKTCALKP